MAMTSSVVLQGTDTFIADFKATADGDTGTLAIAHGLGVRPAEFYLTPINVDCYYKGNLFVSALDATNITLSKISHAGSGSAEFQCRVICKRPHTIGR